MNALPLDQIRPAPLEWLWPGRIPLGKITLLIGDPGVGKSLVALDLAARVSTDAPWPDEPPANDEARMTNDEAPSAHFASSDIRHSSFANSSFKTSSFPPSPPPTALLLTAEDDLADTIRPRLEAAGADCARVLIAPPGWTPDDPQGLHSDDLGIPDLRPKAEVLPPPRPFDLRHDVRFIDGLLACRNCRLLIIDPIRAFVGGSLDSLNAEVHRCFSRLAALAARRRMAVVVVTHLRRDHGSALHRAASSLAYAAAARTAWLIEPDPQDPDRRLLLPVKSNLSVASGGLSFKIATAAPGRPPTIEWLPDAVNESTDDVLRRKGGRPNFARREAARWLQDALAPGARRSIEVQNEAEAHGLSLNTLRRAFRDLGGESVRTGYGPLSEWHWRLPGVGDPEPKPSFEHLWINEPQTTFEAS